MDRRESPEAPATSPSTVAAAVAAGPALRRALERYALRDLKQRKHDEYQQQNAADAALIDQLRHKRNEKVESIDQRAWGLRTTHELTLASYREPWINAHERSVLSKRATQQALASSRAAHNPAERATIEKMRVAHRAAQDAFATESHELNLARESALLDLRSRWNEARGRTIDAKRTLSRVHGEHPASKERDAQVKHEALGFHELLCASQIAWEEARHASLAHAQAAAELAYLEQTGADDETLQKAREHEAAERKAAKQYAQAAKDADQKAAEALVEANHDNDASGIKAEAKLQAALMEAQDQETVEKRRAQRAVKTYKMRTRAQEQAAFDDLRTRRNAESEAYRQNVQAVYEARGEREAALRSDYLDLRAEETAARRQAASATKAYAQQEKPAYTDALEKLRLSKNAENARFSAAVQAINKSRELGRSDDRNEVRANVDQVLQAYENGSAV